MWRKLPRHEEAAALKQAVEFTGNADLYGAWMLKVIEAFPRACEHNLTDQSLNKQAWIGHAACALAYNLPEYIVRKAWALLSDDQRNTANARADEAISRWSQRYLENSQDDKQMCLDIFGAGKPICENVDG
jgi:hypothetical protein